LVLLEHTTTYYAFDDSAPPADKNTLHGLEPCHPSGFMSTEVTDIYRWHGMIPGWWDGWRMASSRSDHCSGDHVTAVPSVQR